MPKRTQKKSTSKETQQVPTSQAKPDASSARTEDRLERNSFDSSTEDKQSSIGNSEFQLELLDGLIQDSYKFQPNNTDFWRSEMGRPGRINGMLGRVKRRLEDRFLLFASRKGFVRRPPTKAVSRRLVRTLRDIDELERFYRLLQDDYSRELLIELLKFRILGRRHVRLPSNNEEFWARHNSVEKSFLEERRTFRTSWEYDPYLDRYKLPGNNGPLSLHTYPGVVVDIFLLEQYAYQKGHKTVKVEPGDTVIDGGAGYGDSALYFADKAAPHGHVYGFEFDPENLDIFHENLNLNRHLSDNIKVVPKALYDKSGETVGYIANSVATRLDVEQQHTTQASTLSIDDFVKEERIEKVDFIKMDIEGVELAALRGAEETLRSFRPKLAIALYHKREDFVSIPDYLDKLGLGYEFFLDVFTIHLQEIILFASPAPD